MATSYHKRHKIVDCMFLLFHSYGPTGSKTHTQCKLRRTYHIAHHGRQWLLWFPERNISHSFKENMLATQNRPTQGHDIQFSGQVAQANGKKMFLEVYVLVKVQLHYFNFKLHNFTSSCIFP